jgi:hypothetical protein
VDRKPSQLFASGTRNTGVSIGREEWRVALTMSEAAVKLGVSNHQIRRLIKQGILAADQVVPDAPYQIRANDLLAARGSSQSFSDGETMARHLNCPEREPSVDVA